MSDAAAGSPQRFMDSEPRSGTFFGEGIGPLVNGPAYTIETRPPTVRRYGLPAPTPALHAVAPTARPGQPLIDRPP